MKKKISEYKLDNKVFHKEGTDEELYQSYKSAKVFVFPSIQEGFVTSLVEAMQQMIVQLFVQILIFFKETAGDELIF